MAAEGDSTEKNDSGGAAKGDQTKEAQQKHAGGAAEGDKTKEEQQEHA